MVPPIDVLLLSKADCAFCEQAKEILTRLGQEYHLRQTTCDIASHEGQTLALSSGILFPPGIFLDGQPFSYGRLSERRLRRELVRRQVATPGFNDQEHGVTHDHVAKEQQVL